MENSMDAAGYPMFSYIMFRRWHDPRSGLRSSVAGPRFSQGYTAAQNRIGLLVENHSLKDYKTRVSSTYELLHFLCGFLNEQATGILELNSLADLNKASLPAKTALWLISAEWNTMWKKVTSQMVIGSGIILTNRKLSRCSISINRSLLHLSGSRKPILSRQNGAKSSKN
jgi:hypothetical protein